MPAEAVLKISNPVAGLVTGLAEFNTVKAMRGGRNPLLVEETSSFAEASGVVVPMPVWAKTGTSIKLSITKNKNLLSI